MKFSNNSNLILAIKAAIDDCYEFGTGQSGIVNHYNDKIVKVTAEWVESKREGYSVIEITILENDIPLLVYDDYGTECSDN